MTSPTLTTITQGPAAEPTMVAVAIAKMDQAALRIAMHVDATPGELPIVLPYQDWHQILNDLAGARAALRTQQIINRRGADR